MTGRFFGSRLLMRNGPTADWNRRSCGVSRKILLRTVAWIVGETMSVCFPAEERRLESLSAKSRSLILGRRNHPKPWLSPKFRPGDCLSIRLGNGQYAAAVVLAADHSNVEYGKNLIGVLDYLSADKPTMDVFRKRKWLVRTHHNWNGQMDLAWYQPLGSGRRRTGSRS